MSVVVVKINLRTTNKEQPEKKDDAQETKREREGERPLKHFCVYDIGYAADYIF